jgi:hypothetical protein
MAVQVIQNKTETYSTEQQRLYLFGTGHSRGYTSVDATMILSGRRRERRNIPK